MLRSFIGSCLRCWKGEDRHFAFFLASLMLRVSDAGRGLSMALIYLGDGLRPPVPLLFLGILRILRVGPHINSLTKVL